MEIRTLIIMILAIPAFYLALRYNMHMFQLNGYKNGEHIYLSYQDEILIIPTL